MLNYWCAWT